jgi:hypothetical protein
MDNLEQANCSEHVEGNKLMGQSTKATFCVNFVMNLSCTDFGNVSKPNGLKAMHKK